jgi:hypothetical protein
MISILSTSTLLSEGWRIWILMGRPPAVSLKGIRPTERVDHAYAEKGGYFDDAHLDRFDNSFIVPSGPERSGGPEEAPEPTTAMLIASAGVLPTFRILGVVYAVVVMGAGLVER